MITEFTAQSIAHQQEHELVRTLERRRLAAERAVNEHGGDRLALIAHLARESRRAAAPRATSPHPAG
ncbi:hypothetical protein [Aeromicrobium endophyticum]|uniref:Uncharacterized protein n=1 Tax=Aeromicrobium endophyticum TaxID=2292704 RepID=A0A371P441_9ACTN|nr:hypothetical protein [Aeromicrobium endophyticum]REK70695.1 hypothetical protein DX116_16460 [Aeromicrobium endophyticum]